MPIDRLTAAIEDGRPLLVLSPHLDDAVLSCGALLSHACRRVPVTVATVFSEGAPPPYTLSARRFLKQTGAGDAEQLYEARRAEDREVLEGMGVGWLHAGFTEALFRREPEPPQAGLSRSLALIGRLLPEVVHLYPTYRLHITSGRLAARDVETLHRVCTLTDRLLHPQDDPAARGSSRTAARAKAQQTLLLAPLAVGGHVDHLLVRTAAELAESPVAYYSDFPYNRRHTADRRFVSRHTLVPFEWTQGLAAKEALVRGYRTQVDALFPGGRIPTAPEVYLMPAGPGASTPTPAEPVPPGGMG
ncbi:PIG-L deacetylase family protein [Phaeacidiphilus oryzae]|uniref:PIG-L deacetylase family protein n=1 Tax=Phaeacidiphilus oryzae TaxID=348818 RepID=UPI000A067FB8|nr:PIG-L family deacetylase [Phaeacidiphilus oryzae]